MLENPFKPIIPENDTDSAANANIVGTFLGPEAQAAYEKLDQGREEKKGDDLSDLRLTDTEKAVVKEAREKDVWDRDRYIEWAESFGGNVDWIDRVFTFNLDGSVECEDLYLDVVTELHEFPTNLKIGGYLDLNHLTAVQGLTLPISVGGDLVLPRLTSTDGLTLPESVGGNLHLNSLTTAQGLTLPKYIGGDLYLSSLKSSNGLELPESVGGNIYYRVLSLADRDDICQRYPQYASKMRRPT